MPFQSKAQARLFGHKMQTGEISKATFDEWAHSTPGGIESLPEHKTKAAKTAGNTQPATAKARSKRAAVAPVGRVRKIGSTGTGSRTRGRSRK